MTRRKRAFRHFRSVLRLLFQRHTPAPLHVLAGVIADVAEASAGATDIWQLVRPELERELRKVRYGSGTLAHAVE